MSLRGARATRNPNNGSLLKISPFGRNDKNGGYSKLSIHGYSCYRERGQGVRKAKGSRSQGFKDSSGSLGTFFKNQKRQGVRKAKGSRIRGVK